jgi:ribosome-binding protein aMBF1 (putative translation factor)
MSDCCDHCADVYAPEMAGLTTEQREIWRRRVDAAQHDVERQNAGVDEKATAAVNDYIVALERVAEAARECVGLGDHELAAALAALDNKEAK